MEKRTLIALAGHAAKTADLICEASKHDVGFGVMAHQILRIECSPLFGEPVVQIDIQSFYDVFGDKEYAYHDTPSSKSVEVVVNGVRFVAVM